MKSKFMIKLQGTVYANELYKFPSLNGEHIYDLSEAIEQARRSFPKCIWTVYNGEESYCNVNDERCDTCPYYDVNDEICKNPMGCLQEGVEDE